MLTTTKEIGKFGSFGTNPRRSSRGTGGGSGHVWVAKEGVSMRGGVSYVYAHQAY